MQYRQQHLQRPKLVLAQPNAQDEERVGLRLLDPFDVPAVESSNQFGKREAPHPGRCPRGTRGHPVIE